MFLMQGCSDQEVNDKVSAFRKMLMGVEVEKKEFAEVDEFGRPILKDSHQVSIPNFKNYCIFKPSTIS